MTVFHPDSIKENNRIPHIVITKFRVLEQDYPIDSIIKYNKRVELNYQQNSISFEFAALSYIFPEKNQLATVSPKTAFIITADWELN